MTAGDFFFPEYKSAFTAMAEMFTAGQPISVETVASHMNRTGSDNVNILSSIGGVQTLAACLSGATPSELEFWRDETIRNRKKRDLDDTMVRFRQKLASSGDPDALRSEMEERLAHLAGPDASDVAHISDTSDRLMGRVQRYITDPDAITGLATGWPKWDRLLDGLRPGGVTIVYAKSSRYKSLFVQNMGHLFASQGHAGLWFTTEMPRLDVQERLLQLELGLNLRRLRKSGTLDQHVGEIAHAMEAIDALPLYLSDGFGVTTSSLFAEVRRYKRWHNIKYVVVDLVDHIQTNKFANDTTAQQSHVARVIKDVAKKEDVHVIAISHVAKGDHMNERNWELPYEDIKGSSSKYQDVDIAVCIVPVAYGIPPEKRNSTRPPADNWYGLVREEIEESIRLNGEIDVMVTITKNRDGETGSVRFCMDAKKGGRFYPYDN